MRSLASIALFGCVALLASCSGPGTPDQSHMASEGLSDRLNRSYGYEVDDKGNWLPKNDKRSQYEGRGGSGYFSGAVSKKSFGTNQLNKGSWMGGSEVQRPSHHLSGTGSNFGGSNRFSSQQASLNRNLQTPTHIAGNHLPDRRANETHGQRADKPSDAETDVRRRVFNEPDIIDYRQQREMSIQESKQLLGRE